MVLVLVLCGLSSEGAAVDGDPRRRDTAMRIHTVVAKFAPDGLHFRSFYGASVQTLCGGSLNYVFWCDHLRTDIMDLWTSLFSGVNNIHGSSHRIFSTCYCSSVRFPSRKKAPGGQSG